MSYELINELSESRMFPSMRSLIKLSVSEVATLAYLHLLSLRIILAVEDTTPWGRSYARRTMRDTSFAKWQSNGTDLQHLLYALQSARKMGDSEAYRIRIFSQGFLTRFLRNAGLGHTEVKEIRRLFLRLDYDLGVQDSSMKAIRRLVMNWEQLTTRERRLATTRLLQFMRSRAPRSDLLPILQRAARTAGLELHNVCNLENGEDCGAPEQTEPKSFMGGLAATALGAVAGYAAIKALGGDYNHHYTVREDATAGSTSASAVASVPSVLGVGFGPVNGEKTKVPLIRRTPPKG